MNRHQLEDRLRREAAAVRPAAAPGLAARTLRAIADDRAALAQERARARTPRWLAAAAIPLAAGAALAVWLLRGATPAPAPAPHAREEVAVRPTPARDPIRASSTASATEPDASGLDAEFEALRSDLRAGGDLVAAALPEAPVANGSGRAR